MAVFIVNNNGENHYVNACNKDRALWLIKKRLLEKYGRYNITDIKQINPATQQLRRGVKEVSTLKSRAAN